MNIRRSLLPDHFLMHKVFPVIAALVLLSQTLILAHTAHAQSVELNSLLTSIRTEIDSRSSSITAAITALGSLSNLSSSSKSSVSNQVSTAKAAIQSLQTALTNVKTLADAQALAKNVDAEFAQAAGSVAAAMTLKDTDSQQGTLSSLKDLASKIQTKINSLSSDTTATSTSTSISTSTSTSTGDGVGGAGGGGAAQDQMDVIKKLMDSIGAILTSVVTLIIALASGNFTQAAAIFQTIIGQLGQNMSSIATAQQSLGNLGLNINIGSIGGSSAN